MTYEQRPEGGARRSQKLHFAEGTANGKALSKPCLEVGRKARRSLWLGQRGQGGEWEEMGQSLWGLGRVWFSVLNEMALWDSSELGKDVI